MALVKTSHPKRGEVFLVGLDPTRGAEIQKARPCLVVSPDELNSHLRTAIIAPMTTVGRDLPFRVACRFENKAGHVVLDQLRTVDRDRLVKRLGRVGPGTLEKVLSVLQEMFSP